MAAIERTASFLTAHRYIALTALCALLYLTNPGGYRLFDVDEPRYAATAKGMVESGDWCVPYFNGEYRFEKPVLTYWLIGASYLVFGVDEAAARFPSAMCATGTVLLTCLLGARLLSPGAGLIAGAALALSIQFLALGRMALTDMPLTFFFTACLALFFLADREPRPGRARLLYLGSFLACGLAVLTKGPVGMVLPGAIAAGWLLAAGRLREGLARIPWISGLLVLTAVCLPWYLLVNLRSDWEFFRVFIVRHNIQRFASEVAPGGQHVEPFWYYLPVLLAGAWPWSLFAVQAMIAPIRKIWRTPAASRAVQPELFPLLWALGVILFFSAAKAKLPTYITPAFPPLALLLSAYWQSLAASGANRPKRLLAPVLAAAVIGTGAGVFLLLRGGSLGTSIPAYLPALGAAAFSTGPLLALFFALRGRPLPAFCGQAVGQVFLALFIALAALPAVSLQRQEPQVELLEKAGEFSGGEGSLAAYRYRKTALVYYSGKVISFVEPGQCARLDSLPPPLTVLTRSRHLAELQDSMPALEIISRSGDLVLLGNK